VTRVRRTLPVGVIQERSIVAMRQSGMTSTSAPSSSSRQTMDSGCAAGPKPAIRAGVNPSALLAMASRGLRRPNRRKTILGSLSGCRTPIADIEGNQGRMRRYWWRIATFSLRPATHLRKASASETDRRNQGLKRSPGLG